MKGKIVKGIGGFYYVEAADVIYECKARGSFRKQRITPLVGDDVEITVNENAENTIDEIFDRKNSFIRPPISNIDRLFIVSSAKDPVLNPYLIDKLIAVAEHKNVEPIIVFTKIDLSDNYKEFEKIYKDAGFKVVSISNTNTDNADTDEIKRLLKNSVSAFTGNTGVGKSSLLNSILPSLNLEVGETSKKLGRGRHTTRHCELLKVCDGYVADTPGFSSLDIERFEYISKDDLPYCFREFKEYLGRCRFTSCSHTVDKGCAVKNAVDDGKISVSRFNSYKEMYSEVKNIKEWEKK